MTARQYAVRVPDHGSHATVTLHIDTAPGLAPTLQAFEDKCPLPIETQPHTDAADRWKVQHPGGHELLVVLWPGDGPRVSLADGVSSWSWLPVTEAVQS